MKDLKPVRVRFAPSPTGHTHLGSGRTALYDYLLARQSGGKFILRIEDTDQSRFVANAEQELIESLHWLGLDWDEGPDVGGPCGPYRQSERKDIYQEHARWLIDKGFAYYCFCTPERLKQIREERQKQKLNQSYDGFCRRIDPDEAARRVNRGESHVIRFKMPREGIITIHDHLRGDITYENNNLDDYIIVRSDGYALYHLGAMVDDHLMGITHVIRGSEWLSTFPLHVHIVRAFGWAEPDWVHLSVFLKPSGKGKMSKRETADLMKDGYSIYLKDLENLGYTPEGVVNWIALMGWSLDDRTEFFTMNDLIEKFSLDRLNPAPAAINFSKLDHFNGLHIRNLDNEELARRVEPYLTRCGYRIDDQVLQKAIPIIKERLVSLDEAPDWVGFFFQEQVSPDFEQLIPKHMDATSTAGMLRKALAIVSTIPDFSAKTLEYSLRKLVEEEGLSVGQLFGALRIAITGQKVSPPLFESMEIVGRKLVVDRIQAAIIQLEGG